MGQICLAGREYGFEGRWSTPCPKVAVHAIASPAHPPIYLCEEHFREAVAAGLVMNHIGKEEYDRRERDRRAGHA